MDVRAVREEDGGVAGGRPGGGFGEADGGEN